MKKIRNLLAVASCVAFMILGIQLRTSAQQKPKEQTEEAPRDLGRNAGTGDPILRTGTWELDGIKTTMINPIAGPGESKELPVDTRERSGIAWSDKKYFTKVAVVFMDLKEIVTGTNASGANPSLKVLIKTDVTYVGGTNAYLLMKCNIDFTSASGDRTGGVFPYFKIYPAQYPDYKRDEFTCGGDLRPSGMGIGGKDFTINLELTFYTNQPVVLTYHFYYRFGGWKVANPGTPGVPTNPPGDTGVAPSDRDGQYRWAQKQDAAALESRLISNASRLFNSGTVSAEKLSSAFADVSIIIADQAAQANFSPDDKEATSSNWSTHRNRATKQGPKASLVNLQQRLRAAFNYLSRTQKDLFFADVSVAMAKAEVGGPGNQTAASTQGQNRPLVQPTKSVFGVNEEIAIDYYNPNGSGWDWVVIVNPNNTAESKGPFSSIDDRYGKRFDANDNSLKERNGTFTFRGLPEGEYEARYVAWYLDGKAGANKILGPVRFRVGNQVSATPPPGPGSVANPPTAVNPAKDLTGLWRNPGGNGVYRLRQVGNKLVWGLDAVALGSYANVFQGQIADDKIDGVWEDLPGSPTIGGGRMLLRIESECKFVRVSSVNTYGADAWVRIGSSCDNAGLAQRANPEGTKPASRTTTPITGLPAKTKPNTEVIAENRSRANPAPPLTNKTNKPPLTVEEIPEDNSTKVAANKPRPRSTNEPLVVEEIPEDNSPQVAANRPSTKTSRPPVVEEIPESETGNRSDVDRSTNSSPRPAEKLPPNVVRNRDGKLIPKDGYEWANPNDPKDFSVKKTKKPSDPNKPDIWTRLGEAVRQGISNQPPPQQAPPQQPTGDGSCSGGAYGVVGPGQARAGERFKLHYTAPSDHSTNDWIGIFTAGKQFDPANPNANLAFWGYLDQPGGCLHEDVSLPAGHYDVWIFWRKDSGNTRPVYGPYRLVISQ